VWELRRDRAICRRKSGDWPRRPAGAKALIHWALFRGAEAPRFYRKPDGKPEFNGEGCRAEDPGATFRSKAKSASDYVKGEEAVKPHRQECLCHSKQEAAGLKTPALRLSQKRTANHISQRRTARQITSKANVKSYKSKAKRRSNPCRQECLCHLKLEARGWRLGLRAGAGGYGAARKATTAFSPPKAKELESAACTRRARDWLGT
jgi:hypothetical protein